MTTTYDQRAIGVFDSGLGGLTVARALRDAFPNEKIFYLGDTARVPYGTKSAETVKLYAREDMAFLQSLGVKVLVAACNTVSAAALPELVHCYDVPVLGVVDKGAEAALAVLDEAEGRETHSPTIGVIGTNTTVSSNAYVDAIMQLSPRARVVQKACTLFVPLIEEGWFDHDVTRAVAAEYLEPMRSEGVDALILGCTHYPLIRPVLQELFGPDVQIVDSAQAMVRALGFALDSGEIAPSDGKNGLSHYYATDRYHRFRELVLAFMGDKDLRVELIRSEDLTAALMRSRTVPEAT